MHLIARLDGFMKGIVADGKVGSVGVLTVVILLFRNVFPYFVVWMLFWTDDL